MQGFIGEIRLFAGNFAPRSWAFCEGQLLAISQNTALFSILGTTYGGDGRTTFGLPALRGRTALHTGNGPGLTPRPQGQKGGSQTNTLTTNNLPSHNHTAVLSGTVKPNVNAGEVNDVDDPSGAYLSAKSDDTYASAAAAGEFAGALNNSMGITLGNAGNQQAIGNEQPYLTTNYIICLQGTFPSRS